MPWLLARAHLKRRRTQNLVTVAGIAVGVAVLIAALSLTNGFTRSLVDATLRASPHLSVQPYLPGARDAALWQAYEKEFGGVAMGSDEAFMDVFAKEFRRAYNEQARRSD